MDAYFASIEQRDNPDLRGKPVAVGGSKLRGVVAAASYEARKYGVKSAMPSATAARLCPDLIFVKPRFEQYKAVSTEIRSIFHQYTDLVEPLSLDEAYLDVTINKLKLPSATLLAKEIRRNILEVTGLNASAGISYNKFLAKIASDVNKPNGMFTITPKTAAAFLQQLPIEKFHGIGKATAKKMRQIGISSGAELLTFSQNQLIGYFGKVGLYYYEAVRGIDKRKVQPFRQRKSVGTESTFNTNLENYEDFMPILQEIAQTLSDRLVKCKATGTTLTLKMKFSDFTQKTKAVSIHPYTQQEYLFERAIPLLHALYDPEKPVRLLGLTVSNIQTAAQNAQIAIPFRNL